jgi:bifunctional DNA-binding transcriptional regulator/antitoxin component of YhaV-PrlF toxin-antitoxin module
LAIREHLKLRPGDRLEFVINDSDEVILRPATVDVREIKGLLKDRVRQPVTVAEMNTAVRERAGESA